MSSSSSNSSDSSSSSGDKRKKKKKKQKRQAKEDKKKKKKKLKKEKDKKAGKKEEKRAERAETWACNRADAVRLLGQLQKLGVDVPAELGAIFGAIDSGETVQVDGIEDKQARKKLRHLFQALRLEPVQNQGFRTGSLKVSFAALFQTCWREAMRCSRAGGPHQAFVDDDNGDELASGRKDPIDEAAGQRRQSPGPEAGNDGSSDIAAASADTSGASRRKGPQLPVPGVGGNSVVSLEDEEEDVEGKGPQLEGSERRGVDIDSMPSSRPRESWMTEMHGSLAGMFGEGGQRGGSGRDSFDVKRSKQETEAFERMVKARGPSLLEQMRESKSVSEAHEAAKKMMKEHNSSQDLWGVSVRTQEDEAKLQAQGAKVAPTRRAFDPEKDMARRPITGNDFGRLVEDSGANLTGRFMRGGISASFL